MMKKTLIAASIALAALGGAMTAPAAYAQVYVQVAPPAPRVEVVPAARRGYVWVPGHWNWNGRRHVWAAGYWVRERPGFRYEAPRWVENNGRWYMAQGRWNRGDRDGDGVPNRLDNRPNDPTRR